jgi:hypothetical protein
MEAATARDEIVAGPQIQVIGVAEQNVRAERLELLVRDALDRTLGADRHERRRLDDAMRRRHPSAARAGVGVRQVEAEG